MRPIPTAFALLLLASTTALVACVRLSKPDVFGCETDSDCRSGEICDLDRCVEMTPPPDPCANGACDCPPGRDFCGGGCVDLATDPENCGGCGNACASRGGSCVGGICECHGIVCGDRCVDPAIDDQNCGECGVVCSAPTSCVAETCQCPDPALTLCSGTCVDTSNDLRHCGGCGLRCNLAGGCVEGRCGLEPLGEPCSGADECASGVCEAPTNGLTGPACVLALGSPCSSQPEHCSYDFDDGRNAVCLRDTTWSACVWGCDPVADPCPTDFACAHIFDSEVEACSLYVGQGCLPACDVDSDCRFSPRKCTEGICDPPGLVVQDASFPETCF